MQHVIHVSGLVFGGKVLYDWSLTLPQYQVLCILVDMLSFRRRERRLGQSDRSQNGGAWNILV